MSDCWPQALEPVTGPFSTERVEGAAEGQSIARADFRFSRRDVREHLQMSDTQLRVHLGRLVEMEYVLVHTGRRGRSFVYELVYESQQAEEPSFLAGLIDATTLPNAAAAAMTPTSRVSNHDLAGSTRVDRAPNAAASRIDESPLSNTNTSANGESEVLALQPRARGINGASYRTATSNADNAGDRQ